MRKCSRWPWEDIAGTLLHMLAGRKVGIASPEAFWKSFSPAENRREHQHSPAGVCKLPHLGSGPQNCSYPKYIHQSDKHHVFLWRPHSSTASRVDASSPNSTNFVSGTWLVHTRSPCYDQGFGMCLSMIQALHGDGVSPPHIYSEALQEQPGAKLWKRQTWLGSSRNRELRH